MKLKINIPIQTYGVEELDFAKWKASLKIKIWGLYLIFKESFITNMNQSGQRTGK